MCVNGDTIHLSYRLIITTIVLCMKVVCIIHTLTAIAMLGKSSDSEAIIVRHTEENQFYPISLHKVPI